MNFSEKASSLFPGVVWTGGSEIHASLATSNYLPIDPAEVNLIMHMLAQYKIGSKIWSICQRNFGEMSWEVSEEEFVKLFLVDSRHHLLGEPDSQFGETLVNPVTGNRFHRMALLGDVVGGVRFWADPAEMGVLVGFRFRCEALDEDANEVHTRIRRTIEEVETDFEIINEGFFDVKEPSNSQTQSAETLAALFEES